MERLLVTLSAVGIVLLTVADPYRSAGVCGEDHYKSWGSDYLRHSDSGLLLGYDVIITGLHIFCPIRSCASWIVPAASVIMYIASTLLFGGPESPYKTRKAAALLALLGILAWIGKRKMEKEIRLAFAEKERLRVDAELHQIKVVEERVKRFDAEFGLEQAKGNGPRMPGSEVQSDTGHAKVATKMPMGLQMASSAHFPHARNVDSPAWCFNQLSSLASDSSLICLDSQRNSLKIIQAAEVGPGSLVLTISTDTNKPALALVTSVCQSMNDTAPSTRWQVLSVGTGDEDTEQNVTVTDSLYFPLAHNRCGLTWRSARKIDLPDDRIHGIRLTHHCSCGSLLQNTGPQNNVVGRSIEGSMGPSSRDCTVCLGSGGLRSGGPLDSVRSIQLGVTQISVIKSPPVMVGLKFGNVSQDHALLVGGSFSSTMPLIFIATSLFACPEDNSSDSCSNSKRTIDAASHFQLNL